MIRGSCNSLCGHVAGRKFPMYVLRGMGGIFVSFSGAADPLSWNMWMTIKRGAKQSAPVLAVRAE